MRRTQQRTWLLGILIGVGLWTAPDVLAQNTPQPGGILRVAIAGDAPSLDMHQEQTFMVTIPLSPVYNTLVMFDPHNYPKVIGDLASGWNVSPDGQTYTFTLHRGVTFHDGSTLTSADIKASWDKIAFPTAGVVSTRKTYYQMIKSIETPDRDTVVFHLHYPSASFLTMLAHPANFIYAKKYLEQDMHYYKRHAMGTGPFKLKSYVRGSSLELERNPQYWKKGLPYLQGAKYFIITDDSARSKSVRSDRTDVEFRGFNPAEAEAAKQQLGERIVVAHPGQPGHWGVVVNVEKKPFDDERVRKALTLAIDRYDMARTLAPLTSLDTVGGLIPPGAPWALNSEELQALPGFSKDHAASLREAKRLLAEAGYPNGFQTVLTNRSVKLPYIDLGVYLVSAWKKIGVEAEHKLEESATWSQSRRDRNFELLVDPYGTATIGDPDELLTKFVSNASNNWGRFSEPAVDTLFDQQKIERDEQKRAALVKELQRAVLNKAWWIPGLWWTRLEVRTARLQNYHPMPSHWMNRRLEDVWLRQK
ncbi:MAG: ABC transporter substrate-binding protein [Candidatus Tectimicrobiota bacterium]